MSAAIDLLFPPEFWWGTWPGIVLICIAIARLLPRLLHWASERVDAQLAAPIYFAASVSDASVEVQHGDRRSGCDRRRIREGPSKMNRRTGVGRRSYEPDDPVIGWFDTEEDLSKWLAKTQADAFEAQWSGNVTTPVDRLSTGGGTDPQAAS